ncbi:MAG: hypothetical protein J6L92_02635, partial [Clostridia bacterium]|nr:hypothetical protein [Clostridia bacterium]
CDFPSRLDHPPLKRFYTVKLIRHGTLGQLVCKSSLVLGREPGKYILAPVFVNIVLLFFTNKEVIPYSYIFIGNLHKIVQVGGDPRPRRSKTVSHEQHQNTFAVFTVRISVGAFFERPPATAGKPCG